MKLIGQDINGQSSAKLGREGMDYWHVLVLASVRLGCNYTYDQIHDLCENHFKLRAIPNLCLPKPGAKQSQVQLANADDEFLAAQQNHPGVESAIGALQSGNGMKRCRDLSEIGFERYVSLAILGRNLPTLGRMLIAAQAPDSAAASTGRKAV